MATVSFIQLAQQAQKELDGETARLAQKESELNTEASAVAGQLALAEKRTGELNAKEKQLQTREEEVSRREINARRDSQVQEDLKNAQAHHVSATQELKKAQEYRDDAQMKLEDLQKRELALSEREKVYKQELELEVMRNFTFRK